MNSETYIKQIEAQNEQLKELLIKEQKFTDFLKRRIMIRDYGPELGFLIVIPSAAPLIKYETYESDFHVKNFIDSSPKEKGEI